MTPAAVLLAAVLAAGCLLWIAIALLSFLSLGRLTTLAQVSPPAPAAWPKVSLVIPACNEESTLREAVESRLREGYPDLEVVIVEDRSVDGTARVADELARADPRVRVVHVDSVPEGWLGKVNALRRGADVATGEWILFTDADVHFAPGTLEKSVAWCEARGHDLLAAVPQFSSGGLVLDASVSSVLRLILIGTKAWAIEDPRSPASIGSGSFNLVRRSTFAKTPGFEWIRTDPADDVALGVMMKHFGARVSMIGGRGHVFVRWYATTGQLVRGSERASFSSMARYSLARGLAVSAFSVILDWSPYLSALLPFSPMPLRLLGLAALVLGLPAAAAVNRWVGFPILPALVPVLGNAVMTFALVRASWLGHRRGGIVWRGTFYSNDMLRAGRRVTLL